MKANLFAALLLAAPATCLQLRPFATARLQRSLRSGSAVAAEPAGAPSGDAPTVRGSKFEGALVNRAVATRTDADTRELLDLKALAAAGSPKPRPRSGRQNSGVPGLPAKFELPYLSYNQLLYIYAFAPPFLAFVFYPEVWAPRHPKCRGRPAASWCPAHPSPR